MMRKRALERGECTCSKAKKKRPEPDPPQDDIQLALEIDDVASEAAGAHAEAGPASEAVVATSEASDAAATEANGTDGPFGLLTPVLNIMKCTVCKSSIDPVKHRLCPNHHFACVPKCVSTRKQLCPACNARYKSKKALGSKLPIGARKLLEEDQEKVACQSEGGIS